MFAQPQAALDPDKAVRSTDDDAAHARISAVRKGYLEDPYISLLVPRPHLVPSRPPLINIGTFVRSKAIDDLIEKWLSCIPDGTKVQIISLGAGSDSRFWRLKESDSKERIARYVEIDLPENIARKGRAIRKHEGTLGALKTEKGGLILSSPILVLVAADLRKAPSNELSSLLPWVDLQLPTLLLSECVLPYLPEQATNATLRWFSEQFVDLATISYDMFGLQDSFGRVMLENLKSRNIELPGVVDLCSLSDIEKRYSSAGFADFHAFTLKYIRTNCLGRDVSERILRLEMLDELEELDLVMEHYAVAWAHSALSSGDATRDFQSWTLATK